MKKLEVYIVIIMNSNKVKNLVLRYITNLSPQLSCALSYIHNRHRLPNFKHPKDLSEIVYSQILSREVLQFVPYVDKISVRSYIKTWGLEQYLPKIYGVWENVDDIDFSLLPDKYALKVNNGCGHHLFCRGKDFDIEKAREYMRMELVRDWSKSREIQYKAIKPKVYAEELLEDPLRLNPIDYKFHCCDGEVRCCLIVDERGTDSGIKVSTWSPTWERLYYVRGKEASTKVYAKPQKLDEMLYIANFIAKKFVQVRVDLYEIGNRIYIGELTFTPEGGMMSYFTNRAVDALGHINVGHKEK